MSLFIHLFIHSGKAEKEKEEEAEITSYIGETTIIKDKLSINIA